MDAVLRHVARVKRLERLIERQARRLQAIDVRARALAVERASARPIARPGARTARGACRAATCPRAAASTMYSRRATRGFRAAVEPSGNFYGLRTTEPLPSASFASARGKPGQPGDRRRAHRVGARAESDGPGLEFQAPVGTAVRAVSTGRVAFSDRYGSYGRLVILDHGDGYYTVYGGLGAVEVRVGDDLSRNARIGSIGTDFSPSALFFEVRKGTRTLEPRSWLGL